MDMDMNIDAELFSTDEVVNLFDLCAAPGHNFVQPDVAVHRTPAQQAIPEFDEERFHERVARAMEYTPIFFNLPAPTPMPRPPSARQQPPPATPTPPPPAQREDCPRSPLEPRVPPQRTATQSSVRGCKACRGQHRPHTCDRTGQSRPPPGQPPPGQQQRPQQRPPPPPQQQRYDEEERDEEERYNDEQRYADSSTGRHDDAAFSAHAGARRARRATSAPEPPSINASIDEVLEKLDWACTVQVKKMGPLEPSSDGQTRKVVTAPGIAWCATRDALAANEATAAELRGQVAKATLDPTRYAYLCAMAASEHATIRATGRHANDSSFVHDRPNPNWAVQELADGKFMPARQVHALAAAIITHERARMAKELHEVHLQNKELRRVLQLAPVEHGASGRAAGKRGKYHRSRLRPARHGHGFAPYSKLHHSQRSERLKTIRIALMTLSSCAGGGVCSLSPSANAPLATSLTDCVHGLTDCMQVIPSMRTTR